jgi:DNA modification methylase
MEKTKSMIQLYTGDSLLVAKDMADNSIDTIITDPPYGLKFMGKEWDHGVPGVEFWKEFLRVAKPGAFLFAFGGTRTFHRLTVAIEDAGWEIRDCVMWLTGQGFPKSLDFAWKMHEQACNIIEMVEYENSESDTQYDMRFVQATYLQTPIYACAKCGQVLQPFMPKQGIQEHRQAWAESETCWNEQSIMERWSNLKTPEGELYRCEICTLSCGLFADGAQGWLYNGTPPNNGTTFESYFRPEGSGTSYRPQSGEQLYKQSHAISIECRAQAFRGFGTALKPAWEPIIVAMKPLDGTFADNALTHGVAGLHIDAGRIETDWSTQYPKSWFTSGTSAESAQDFWGDGNKKSNTVADRISNKGRWPANIILDETSAEMLDAQIGILKSGMRKKSKDDLVKKSSSLKLAYENKVDRVFSADSGGASRFFYVAKASKKERGEYNNHPTVKPIALLEYLCKLSETPTGGIVFDPFMGSGSTGIAARNTDRSFIGIDLNPEYVEIARKRIEHVE